MALNADSQSLSKGKARWQLGQVIDEAIRRYRQGSDQLDQQFRRRGNFPPFGIPEDITTQAGT